MNSRMRSFDLLTALRSRPQWTAGELARELGVSVRTVLRDLDALEARGVALQRTTGPGGGVALRAESRALSPMLSVEELKALAVLAVPSALRERSAPVKRALQNLAAALPAGQRAELDRAKNRLHVDAAGWFQEPEYVKYVEQLERAVWEQRQVRLTSTTFDERVVEVQVEPLGLVVKADAWYLLAQGERGLRSWRISRISALAVLEQRFERPPRFELAAAWEAQVESFRRERPSFPVTFTLPREKVAGLRALRPKAEWKAIRAGLVTIDFERERIARETLARLGISVRR
jgi:predicted DNA-binding transcriptional regulator YafY